MAVTRDQMAQWNREYEKKYPENENKARKTTAAAAGQAAQTSPASTETERVSRSQMAQWGAEFDAKQKTAAYEDYRAKNNLGFADAIPSQSAQSAASSPKVGALGTPVAALLDEKGATGRKQAGSATEGSGLAQKLKASYAPYSQKDDFDKLNEWLDTGDNRNLAEAVRRVDSTHGAYTDEDLIRNGGWTQAQIDEARQKNAELDSIPAWKQFTRRTANAIGGIADSVAGGTAMGGELGVQSAKNIAQTQQNWAKVQQEIKGDARQEKLFRLLTDVDMDYNPVYPESRNRDLVLMGYGSEEIRNMRDRLAGLEVNDGIDKDRSVGYQLYQRGQELTGAAQSGLSPAARTAQGIVTSAAENLAVGAVNPAAVLPVLSLQGASDAMGQSIGEGESAGKALGEGALKFGAGWAINSVGVADLAKTMGSGYAKDSVAGQIAEWVRKVSSSEALQEEYPAVANAISGGIDNAMQAFVETYADKAVDAALGDEDAAKNMLTADTFLEALESGLTGGASGALGGAVGTGIAAMTGGGSLRERVEAGDTEQTSQSAQSAASSPDRGALGTPVEQSWTNEAVRNREREGLATEGSGLALSGAARQLSQRESPWQDGKAVLDEEGAMGREAAGSATEGSGMAITQETAVNDDPAVHTAAQNASIEEYKNSVDPKMAQYIDRVRAGEQLEPYVVTETNDRMRSAMMELTGLEKVGDRTLMDANAVQHITNRHAGGDGSADGTMKESTDMARAAYVLNNFDNVYLAKDRAKGYKDSRGKRAPIVIFEKKIDGSHIVVEAACDTKKNTNFIISEYLSKNGVDKKETVKALRSPVSATSDPEVYVRNVAADTSTATEAQQAPMDAAESDPRHTSETFSAHSSAGTSIAPEGTSVNGRAVENAGESVESAESVESGSLQETAWNREEQKQTARQLIANTRMTAKAAQGVVNAMPEGVGAGVYTQAVNSLYQLGKMEDVTSFEQAVELTGAGNITGGAVRQVLALGEIGENALRIAYTYGKGEAEAYNARKASEIGSGKGALNPDAGTYFKGQKVSRGTDAMDAFIELGAKSNGAAIHRAAEGLKNNAKGLIRAAAGEMYLSGEAGSETVMHETFHLLNEWSPETGQNVMDRMLKYLVQQNGMESTEKLIESYLTRYEDSGVKMTWNQALEEVTADAMETVFGTADGFRMFVRQQAAEAKMNAEARGTIGKVMNRIDELLHKVLDDVNRFLKREPTNAAAKAAKSLTEEQLQDLQSLYFEHQMEAGQKYREALADAKNSAAENAPAETAETTEKFQLHEGKDSLAEQMNDRVERLEAMEPVARISGSEVAFGASRNENIDNVAEYFDSIGNRVNREDFGTVELTRKGARTTVQHGNSRAKQAAIAAVPEVIRKGEQIGHETNWQGRGYDTYVFAAPIMMNGTKLVEGVIVNEYVRDNGRKVFYVHEVCWSDGSYVTLQDDGTLTKKEDIPTQLPKAVRSSLAETQEISSKKSIAQNKADDKSGPTADGKYQLNVDSEDVEATRTEGLGDVEQQTELVGKVMDLAGKVIVSDTGLKNIARAILSDCDSKMNTKVLAERLRALSDYIRLNQKVDWAEANTFVMDMAEQIMNQSEKRNDELWNAYPELHRMGMTIEKGSKDYKEIVYKWGSWANASKELARHGVDIRQSKEGVHSRWDADFTELQELGAGLLPDETPSSAADALEAMAAAHDAIKPVMENPYGEDWEGAQQDLAMQIWQRYMENPEIANEQNAPLRKEFAEKRKEVRDIARQQAAEAKAKAKIAELEKKQEAENDLVEPYRKMTAKAMERKEVAEQFAKKQKESVAATVQRAKDNAAKRVEKARNAREMDNTRRAVNQLTKQLTQMTEAPNEKAYVPEYLLDKVRPVVMLALDAVGNHEAAKRIAAGMGDVYGPVPADTNIRDAMDGLRRGIDREMKLGERAAMEWQQSGIQDEIADWLNDVNENRQIEMEKLRGEIANANKWLTEETPEKKAYIDRLNADLSAYQMGNMATLTVDQLRGLREILEKTMFIVKNENVMLGSIEDVAVDDFAEGAAEELKETAMKQKDGRMQKVLRELGSGYKLNTMNIERNFERLGGYKHGGYMEQLGRMLNDGQFRKERITAEGEKIFENVTGPEHAEELYHFTHDLVDIGLKTDDGKPWRVTHDIMTELWVQLQNPQGIHHLLHGGATIADLSFSTKGMAGLGDQFSETVKLGELVTTDENGNKLNAFEISQREDALRTSLIGEIEKNLTEYDEQWISDFKELGKLTKTYINETSMALYGVKKARVNNYIRLHVDKNTLVEQNEGVKTDRSVGSEGFMKSRQASSKPLELVGLVKQASESIENTAQFAGMAVPLRNAEKVLNSMQGGKTLYGQIERTWGQTGRKYITKAMADLTGTKKNSEVFDRMSSALRGAAAAAVLTGNLNVTLLQAASLPTAAAELGWGSTGQSALQFIKNVKPKSSEMKAVQERAYRFGDTLLPTRLRGSKRGELSKAAKGQGILATLHEEARNSDNKVLRNATRTVDAVADKASGSIGWMDEVTVTALFYGSEQYVQKNLNEFDLTEADLPTKTQEDGSKAYQNAVVSKFQRVVERTQPNYTTMQRTGMQRTENQLAKTLMMFSTQRQQNAQIMVSAVEDLAAQAERYRAKKSAENKAELQKAQKRMADAASSQIVQTAVIAALGIAVKFGLHRWDDLQDENGDMTLWSILKNFAYSFFNSAVSNYTGGSEAWTATETVLAGKSFGSYDSISMTGISALNDVVKTMAKLNGLLDKDTSEMTEKEFEEYTQNVKWAWADAAGQLMMLEGVPYNNGKKYVQAVFAWMDTAKQWSETGERSFSSVPQSATGQYDRLYNAIQSGDREETAAAQKKLEAMGKTDQIDAQLKKRLKEYDEDILEAAEYQNDGKTGEAFDAKMKVFERMRAAYGVRASKDPEATEADGEKRDEFISIVNDAVNEKAKALLAGGKDRGVYDDLTDAVSTGRTKDIQKEIDRLVKAGKGADTIKSKITGSVKDEYLAGSSADRAKLEKKLLALEAGGVKLYEEKTFASWVKQAGKKQEAASQTVDEWKDVR